MNHFSEKQNINNNKLIFGDNLKELEKLRKKLVFFDFIYLDPPFNSKEEYNLFLPDCYKRIMAEQKSAFKDTWSWFDKNLPSGCDTKDMELQNLGVTLAKFGMYGEQASSLKSYIEIIKKTDLSTAAYLLFMASRLAGLHSVLKETGSIMVHMDDSANHHLKVLMDIIFGSQNYINEIIWKRSYARNDSNKFGRIHDCILYYAKNCKFKYWNSEVRTDLDPDYVKKNYRYDDRDGRGLYMLDNLTAPGGRGPLYEFFGVTRNWRYTEKNMHALYNDGRIRVKEGTVPLFKRYLNKNKGRALQDLILDINPLSPQEKERLGYPTQKPVKLLKRFLEAACLPNGSVLDPFCGCGTTLAAAQELGMTWTGIDLGIEGVRLVSKRMEKVYGLKEQQDFVIEGVPNKDEDFDLLGWAEKSFGNELERWVCSTLGAGQTKRVGDGGIDGFLFLQLPDKTIIQIGLQVKSGKTNINDIRAFVTALNMHNCAFGLFIMRPNENTEIRKKNCKDHGLIKIENKNIYKITFMDTNEVIDIAHGDNSLVNFLGLPESVEIITTDFNIKGLK